MSDLIWILLSAMVVNKICTVLPVPTATFSSTFLPVLFTATLSLPISFKPWMPTNSA